MFMLLNRFIHSNHNGYFGLFGRAVHSVIIPLFLTTPVHYNVHSSQISTASSSYTLNTQSRFLCESGIAKSSNWASKLTLAINSSGKIWCSRLAANLAMGNDKWLGKTDPSSFSNPEDFRSKTIGLKWMVNFETKTISGSASHELLVLNPNATELIFDTRDIAVNQVLCNGKKLDFVVGDTVSSFGEPLHIQISDEAKASIVGKKLTVEIHYNTTDKCSALQWLDPVQTAGKRHPYAFSQCQAIHARSIMPCQDTPFVKAAYNAEVSVPKDLQALMSAVLVGEPKLEGANKVYQFEQKVPIPSYLTAIAIGDIVGKSIGPRSRVWAEPEIVDAAAFEFSETESMLQAAENLFGKYVWGIYDILVLPPSFPYGGMENPCLTFATPTLLAGDKSLSNVIAHEIAHSWTGNLVTNNGWEHFWLNEGFTVFAERKIVGALYGEKFRQFVSIGGFDELSERIKEMKPDNPLTRLVVDLNGVDPDDAFSIVPYEKGYAFLYYLEVKVGGPSVFDPFLRDYIQNNSYKSIDSNAFKTQFINYFETKGMSDKISDVNWDHWFYAPGLPVKSEYDQTYSIACSELKTRWANWDPSAPNTFAKSDFDSLTPVQMQWFLQELLDIKAFPLAAVRLMDQVYELTARKNSEIRFRWIRLRIRAKDMAILPIALQFVNDQGRMKFVRPIYRELYTWEEVRPQAIENFKENSKYMMHVTAKMVKQDLHIN